MKHLTLLTACLCAPAFAASTIEISCDEEPMPLHDVSVTEIAADATSHERELAPRVEALIREAFDEETTAEVEDAEDTVEEIAVHGATDRSVTVTLPGVSGEDIERYKRKMYRTDI